MKSFICHAEEERCLKFKEYVLPLCARCTGFYTGTLVGFGSGFFLSSSIQLSAIDLFIFTLMALIPFSLDGILQELTPWESKNWIRFSTGVLIGSLIGIDIWWVLFLGI